MDLWFNDEHTDTVKLSIKVEKQLVSVKSEQQQIDVLDTKEFGKILAVDGDIMLTQRDEFIYHELLVHVPMAINPNIKEVLVIGGGDGGVVRELTKYDSIEIIDVVEIDEELEKVCKEYFPEIANSLSDPRVHMYHEDGVRFIRSLDDEYDLIVIDSVCSSSGYGMLVDDAYDLMQEGKDIKEIVKWIEENKTKIQHQFYSTDLKYLKRGGRVSGPAATVGSILHLCPLMRLNYAGRIIAYSKVIGKKKAIKSIVDEMEAHAENGLNYAGKVFISNSNCLADAEMCKQEILKRFPNVKEIKIFDIGTVIASHTGPGTVALFFHGDERIK